MPIIPNNPSPWDVLDKTLEKISNLISVSETPSTWCAEDVKSDPAERAEQFETVIDYAFLRLQGVFNSDIPLIKPWSPEKDDVDIMEHFDRLKVPTLHGLPCLLIHDLPEHEETRTDQPHISELEQAPNRKWRISSVFLPKSNSYYHSILLNTSGSGKTRLVLEGLCYHWGFYFTCRRRADEIGSSDIQAIIEPAGCLRLQGLTEILPVRPDPETLLEDFQTQDHLFQSTLEKNEDIAMRCFNAVMVARLLVFLCFLKVAEQQRTGLDDISIATLKKMWLFTQLDTRLLGGSEDKDSESDLLMELTCILCTIDSGPVLSQMGRSLFKACKTAIRRLEPGAIIYCVVDEAQVAAEKFDKAFCNSDRDDDRPALRAMLFQWVFYKIRTIITGTSLNRDLIVEVLTSTIAKRAEVNSGVTDTGAWANDGNIQSYLEKYFPQTYLQTESGKELMYRAKYWLWGRPRFVASYVQLVIEHGFRSYHRLFSKCIEAIARFVPNDAVYWESQEADIEMRDAPICPFDFRRASKLQFHLMSIVQKITYERLMSGNLDFGLATHETNYELVECGFARFPGSKIDDSKILFDEPLAYLAADTWINQQGKLFVSRHDHFFGTIGNHSPIANGLERYMALCLAHAFQYFTPLTDVFRFADLGDDNGLTKQRGRLVSCWIDTSEEFRIAPSIHPIETRFHPLSGAVVVGPKSPCHRLGYKPSQDERYEGVLKWLAGRERSPFLFPDNNLGPDLMLRLQLEGSNRIITVVLQVKHRLKSADFSAESDIAHAIRTVTPRLFWLDVNGNVHGGPDDLYQRTIDALYNLPERFNPLDQDLYYSVLRGVFVFPALNNETTCARILEIAEKITLSKRGDIHDICVIPTKSLLELEGPIERGLKFILARHLKSAQAANLSTSRRNQRYAPYNLTEVQEMHIQDLIANMEFSGLDQLSAAELQYQLSLHRRLERIVDSGSGPVNYLTPDGNDLNIIQRYVAVVEAIDRFNLNKESYQI